MDDEPIDYADLPARITGLGLKLQSHPDPQIVDDVGSLLRCVDEFHRRGLTELIGMIQSWRGEIFLESVGRNPLTGPLLKAYELPKTS